MVLISSSDTARAVLAGPAAVSDVLESGPSGKYIVLLNQGLSSELGKNSSPKKG